MKYLLLLAIAGFMSSCSSTQIRALAPNHIGVTPSCEWELQEGCNPKHKPKISTTLDWNF